MRLTLALVAAFLFGCSAPALECIPGSTAACTCTDGSRGAQSCSSEGAGYEACTCAAPALTADADAGGDAGIEAGVCQPGDVEACLCQGFRGARVCNGTSTWFPCCAPGLVAVGGARGCCD